MADYMLDDKSASKEVVTGVSAGEQAPGLCLTPANKEELAALGGTWTVITALQYSWWKDFLRDSVSLLRLACVLGKSPGFWVSYGFESWLQHVLAMSWSRPLSVSEPQFAHLSNGNDSSRYPDCCVVSKLLQVKWFTGIRHMGTASQWHWWLFLVLLYYGGCSRDLLCSLFGMGVGDTERKPLHLGGGDISPWGLRETVFPVFKVSLEWTHLCSHFLLMI